MADTYSQYLNLTLCEVGASRDTWGSKTNANWTAVDQYIYMSAPIGMIIDFAGPNAPSGYLVCDGRSVSRTVYSNLFAVIGTYFGAGDGSTTFNLPNMNGRTGIGPGSVTDAGGYTTSFTFATSDGYIQQAITQANIPVYNLISDSIGSHSHGGAAVGGSHTHTTDTQGNHSHGVNDPGHAHSYLDAALWAGGTQAPYAAGYATTDQSRTTNSATTGISIQVAGNHSHNVNASGNLSLTISVDGVHQHTIPSGGSGTAMTVLSPILVVTKIIYAGSQASVLVAGASVAPTIDGTATEIEELRAEIAELRRILMPPTSRRLLSAPSRGPH